MGRRPTNPFRYTLVVLVLVASCGRSTLVVTEHLPNEKVTPGPKGPPSGAAPVVSANGPYQGTVRVPISFAATVTESGATTFSYFWDLGDGTTSTLASFTHSYSAVGDYNVKLTAMDPAGNSATATTTAQVIAPAPGSLQASVVATPLTGNAPLTVLFTVSLSGGTSPYLYTWGFGDRTPSIGPNTDPTPAHTYSDAGTYIATVNVTDSTGQSVSATATVDVNAPACDSGPRIFRVDSSAPPGGDGVNAAWNSTAQVTAGPISRCPAKYQPGDTIQFVDGSVFAGSVTLEFDSNNVDVNAVGWGDSTPLTLTTKGGGTATIITGRQNGVVVHNLGYIAIQNLSFQGSFNPSNLTGGCQGYGDIDGDAYTNTPYGKGIYLLNDSAQTLRSVIVNNVDIGYYCTGLFAQRDFNSNHPYDHIKLSYLNVHDNNGGGITWRGWNTTDLYVGYNQVSGNHGTGQFVPPGSTSTSSLGSGGEGMILTRIEGDPTTISVIEHNVISNNGGNNPCAPNGGVWGALGIYGEYFLAQDNEIQTQHAYPTCLTDNMGLNINGRHWTAQRNDIHDNDGYGVLLDGGNWQPDGLPDTDGTFRYNILAYNGAFANRNNANHPAAADLMILGAINNYRIYNNTINTRANQNPTRAANPLGTAIYLSSLGGRPGTEVLQDVTFQNNIVIVNRLSDCSDAGLWVYSEPDSSTSSMVNVRFVDNDYYAHSDVGCSPVGSPIVWRGTRYSLGNWAALGEVGERLPVKNVDPQLCAVTPNTAADYKLRSSSPMIDAGVDNGVSGLVDFFLGPAPFGSGYDIGAREWQGADDCL